MQLTAGNNENKSKFSIIFRLFSSKQNEFVCVSLNALNVASIYCIFWLTEAVTKGNVLNKLKVDSFCLISSVYLVCLLFIYTYIHTCTHCDMPSHGGHTIVYNSF